MSVPYHAEKEKASVLDSKDSEEHFDDVDHVDLNRNTAAR